MYNFVLKSTLAKLAEKGSLFRDLQLSLDQSKEDNAALATLGLSSPLLALSILFFSPLPVVVPRAIWLKRVCSNNEI